MITQDRSKPPASISLDLDNQWSYMKIHGDKGWEEYPSYLPVFIPHVLKLLEELNLSITFFIVGMDAEQDENKPYLKLLTENGHEIGNHSHHHDSWLKLYSKNQIEKELSQAEEAIFQATGARTRGFRGPGFSWSNTLLSTLQERGYLYDASTLPTYIGPLARKYYFMTANLTDEEKEQRKELFGSFKDGLRPVKPYNWELSNGNRLLEIPVTTIPIIKTPFHLSYLLYLNGYSKLLMTFYLQLAVKLCRLTKTKPSFLLHPLDLIGGDQIPSLRFFPGMQIDTHRKQAVFLSVIKKLQKSFNLAPMSVHAQSARQNSSLKSITCH